MQRKSFLSFLIAALLVMAIAAPAPAMIGWRHDGTGHFPDDCKPVRQWDGQSGKNIVWKTPLPNFGNGSPIVVGRKAFVVCEPGYPEGVDAPLLVCIDANNGDILWRRQMDPFTQLPAAERAKVTALRAEYWAKLRQVNTMAAAYADVDEKGKAAIQAEAKRIFGMQIPAKRSFKGLTEVPFGPREKRKYWAPLTKGQSFQVPAWRWTGMGPSMTPPVSDGKRIYIVNGFRFTAAYDFDGNPVWMNYHHDIPYRHHWVESCGNAPLIADGKLIAFFLDRLICFEPDTGKELWRVQTREFDGHGMGSPVILRLPIEGSGETVTAVFAQSGELVRVSDGHVYARDIGFFDACACLGTNGRDIIFATNGGSGGAWRGPKMGKGRRFMERGPMAIRLSLKDRDTLHAEQIWSQPRAHLGNYPLLLNGKLYTGRGILDAATGRTLSFKQTRFDFYHGLIHAGGLLIGNDRGGPPKRSEQTAARFITHVYEPPADPAARRIVSYSNALEMVPDPEAGAEHRKKVIAMTGKFAYGQWYGWHNSYSTPFASGNRLFIRTFDYLWCIGKKDEPFTPSKAFEAR